MSATNARCASRRKAIITICKRRGIDDATRRAMQQRITGKSSLTEMDLFQLGDVLDHLNTEPATAKQSWRFVFKQPMDRQTYLRKIYRLAQTIGGMQTPPVEVVPVAYVEAIASRMRGCETVLQFCTPELLHKIVQALEVHIARG